MFMDSFSFSLSLSLSFVSFMFLHSFYQIPPKIPPKQSRTPPKTSLQNSVKKQVNRLFSYPGVLQGPGASTRQTAEVSQGFVNMDVQDVHDFTRVFSQQVSGRFSYGKLELTEANEGNNLVDTWGNVLKTSRYADYDQNLQQPSPKRVSQLTAQFPAVACAGPPQKQ